MVAKLQQHSVEAIEGLHIPRVQIARGYQQVLSLRGHSVASHLTEQFDVQAGDLSTNGNLVFSFPLPHHLGRQSGEAWGCGCANRCIFAVYLRHTAQGCFQDPAREGRGFREDLQGLKPSTWSYGRQARDSRQIWTGRVGGTTGGTTCPNGSCSERLGPVSQKNGSNVPFAAESLCSQRKEESGLEATSTAATCPDTLKVKLKLGE